MVENIECFNTDLQGVTFGELVVLEQRKIKVGLSRSDEDITSSISQSINRVRKGEAGQLNIIDLVSRIHKRVAA